MLNVNYLRSKQQNNQHANINSLHNKFNSMSFIIKNGEDKDRKLAVVRKKYFHNIFQINVKSERERRDLIVADRKAEQQAISKIHQQSLSLLQRQIDSRKKQKQWQQDVLKVEYDKQIKQRHQKLQKQKQTDKFYMRMLQIQSEKASQRRVADLLKIYDRSAVKSLIHKKSKTQPNQIYDPQQKHKNESSKNNSTPFRLPQIQKTSNLKKVKEEYNKLMYYQHSSKVLPVNGSLV